MFKTLLKKQFAEIFSFITFDRRRGKGRTAGGMLLIALVYLLVFGIVGANFYLVASTLAPALDAIGLDWLFFALTGLIGLLFGVIGSVFMTYTGLYVAKDNEFLFSMPIRPRTILNSRIVGVYLMGLVFVLISTAPMLIAYFVHCSATPLAVLFTVMTPFILSLAVLALSCLLGWVVSLIARKVKNKSLITVIVSLAFVAAYLYFYTHAYDILTGVIENPLTFSATVRTYLPPFYLLGKGAAGDGLSFLLFALICLAATGLVYLLLEKSFARSVIDGGSVGTRTARKKAAFSEGSLHSRSTLRALFGKELGRFTASPNYMLNSCIGIAFMLVGAVALFIKGHALSDIITREMLLDTEIIYLLALAFGCSLAAMNNTTAASVSLEGKTIWLLQSLPVPPRRVLAAKLALHLVLVLPPLALFNAALIFAFRSPFVYAMLSFVISFMLVAFSALFGLVLNLRFTNLNWTNEVVPVKQSLPVFIIIFTCPMLPLLFGGLFYLMRNVLSSVTFLGIVLVLLLALDALLLSITFTWGAKRFSELN